MSMQLFDGKADKLMPPVIWQYMFVSFKTKINIEININNLGTKIFLFE